MYRHVDLRFSSKRCAQAPSPFCRTDRRAQSRLTNAIFASVVLAGSLLCRTKVCALSLAPILSWSLRLEQSKTSWLLWSSMAYWLCLSRKVWDTAATSPQRSGKRWSRRSIRLRLCAFPSLLIQLSVALAWQAVAAQMSLAAESQGGG